ncbi:MULTISPECIES: PEP-CTERM sorting domain-containing protein [Rhodopirellula]|uniref:PEP-CTERM sorting domain-containing protein n=1 Tax=Rhodopirellula TaxID=265488 RepID=UPI00257B51A6|nr:PEP-CTERM sorting domain-containing protein [Rhodopirellula sp. UBA1907]
MNRWPMSLIGLLAIGVCLSQVVWATPKGFAAVVTTQEAGVDLIFRQDSFGSSPIDIRFGEVVTIADSGLLNFDSEADYFSLFDYARDTVGDLNSQLNVFYTDQISWCGGDIPAAVGCGAVNGPVLIVESDFAAGAFGAELIAHEIGHNLNLGHTGGEGLMGPRLNNDTTLTATEVATIFESRFVQTELSGARFIQVTPYLIQASAVPEPGAAGMLVAGLAAGMAWRRRRPYAVN